MFPPSWLRSQVELLEINETLRQGHDLELGTNCLAPYLLTTLLESVLVRTAAESAPFSVRVVFVASLMQLGTPPGAMAFDTNGAPKILPKAMDNYMQSKVGVCWLADEFSQRLGGKGILSVVSCYVPMEKLDKLTMKQSVHPGLMKTELQRNMPAVGRMVMVRFPSELRTGADILIGYSSQASDLWRILPTVLGLVNRPGFGT
jgi:NAD(P)-dependent dehydrogenase (short-subunit alcohol dehydrogenase family)